MMWLFILAVLTYCFTVGFTTKHKERAIEEKEKRLEQKAVFDEELAEVLRENAVLRDQLRAEMFGK